MVDSRTYCSLLHFTCSLVWVLAFVSVVIGESGPLAFPPFQQLAAQMPEPAGGYRSPGLSAIPPGMLTGCPYEVIQCQNGGYFDPSQCLLWTDCPQPDDNNETHKCVCPPSNYGVDCSLVSPPLYLNASMLPKRFNHSAPITNISSCPSDMRFDSNTSQCTFCPLGQVWDGTVLNLAMPVKLMECYMFEYISMGYGLREHRVEVQIKFDPGEGLGHILFNLYSRHHNNSQTDPTSPTYYQCTPALPDISCYMYGCQGVNVGETVEYQCSNALCSSCGDDPVGPNAVCSTLIAAILKTIKTANMLFSNVNEYEGTSTVHFSTNGPSFDLVCYTGGCAGSIVPNPGSIGTNPNVYYVTAIFSAIAAFLVGVFLFAACAGRRFKGAEYKYVQILKASNIPVNDPRREEARVALDKLLEEELQELPKFALAFDSIRYSVDVRSGKGLMRGASETRRVLKGVSGYVAAGQMVAILGSSGAGKSSLMDILAARDKSGVVSGWVKVLSPNIVARHRKDVVSYVLQHDHLLSTQTVREALEFAARVQLRPIYSEAFVQAKVRKVMRDLCIEHISDSYIGDSDHGGGISGGERKRVAIGCELVGDPRFLFLDEPTSGLDSFSAQVVMDVLRQTANSGCACMLSIHQPPSKVFAMFDQVLLMSKRGQQLYMGPPHLALEHMQANGYPVANKWINPAEYLLEIASQTNEPELERLAAVFVSSYRYKELCGQLLQAKQMYKRQRMNAPSSFFAKNDVDFGLDDAPALSQLEEPDQMDAPLLGQDGNAIASQYQSFNGNPASLSPTPSASTTYYPSAPVASVSPHYVGEPDEKMSQFVDATATSEMPPSQPINQLPIDKTTPVYRRNHPSCGHKLNLLLGRAFRNILRNPALLFAQILVTTFVSLFIGGAFYHVDQSWQGIQNRMGVLFFTCMYFGLTSISSLGALSEERVLFLRERAANYYGTLPYFLCKIMSDLIPLRVIPPIIYGTVVYKLVNLRAGYLHFSVFLLTLIETNLLCTAIMFAITATFHQVGTSGLVASLFLIFSIVFGGLFLNNQSSSSPLINLKWGSYIHYAFEAVAVNEFPGQALNFDPISGVNTPITGDYILNSFSLDESMMYNDMYCLGGGFILFVALGYLVLRKTRYEK